MSLIATPAERIVVGPGTRHLSPVNGGHARRLKGWRKMANRALLTLSLLALYE
jgi:hypothetical protein